VLTASTILVIYEEQQVLNSVGRIILTAISYDVVPSCG